MKGDRSGKNYLSSGGSSFSDRAVPAAGGQLAGQESLLENHWCQMGFLSSTVTQQHELGAEMALPPAPRTF